MAATSDTTCDPRPITYAEQLAQKRQQEESWAAIARMFAQSLRTWIVPPAIILARRTHDFGWIRLSRVFFRCAWANLLPEWRDSFDDWPVWSVKTREYRDQRRALARETESRRLSWDALARMGFELLRLKAANHLFRLGRLTGAWGSA